MNRRPLPDAEIRTQMRPLLAGVRVMHGAGLLHHDVKPDNIFVLPRKIRTFRDGDAALRGRLGYFSTVIQL
ncbi:hypothetical protein GUJ93_ZPchr0010g9424 [Zizania palustris]|uniref:Protein kinase domain-containing protein n=1 Tax=Zizania palustris TaxID=103762 RepID=A0A8J5WCG6_ZIZPA|nr:hypothetical protein GUJ93_ZPchr0010g9424 [Zizania palustris]